MITESPDWWKRIVRRAAEDGLRAALPKYGRSASQSAGSLVTTACVRSVPVFRFKQ